MLESTRRNQSLRRIHLVGHSEKIELSVVGVRSRRTIPISDKACIHRRNDFAVPPRFSKKPVTQTQNDLFGR